ncbi:MAG: hypothetical protein RR942_07525 [Romboutsia sp.]
MKNKKCSRINSLKEEILNDWDKINLAGKLLIFIGLIVFISTIAIALYIDGSNSMLKTIEVIFRSALSSIFGFILSSNLKRKKEVSIELINRNNIKVNNLEDKIENCEEEIIEHNYREGNVIQLMVAFVLCLASITTILIMYILNINYNPASLSQFRDLMCSSIGFLLGESTMKR